MKKVLVHCPLNISRAMGEKLKEFAEKLSKKENMNIEIEVKPHRSGEEALFKKYRKKGEMPDLTISHANDISELSDEFIKDNFQSFSENLYPLRKELIDSGFRDPEGYFHLFALVPFAIIYNQNLLKEEEVPDIWEDLLESNWQDSILLPDEFRTISEIINAYIKDKFPQRFDDYLNNTVFNGNPVDVVNAVDDGEYPLGIVNISFSRFSRKKNISSKWFEDGTFCAPQIMIFKKEVDQRLLEIGDYIMSKEMQDFFVQQSFIPGAPDISLPSEIEANKKRLIWKGWDHFREIISEELSI